MSFAAILSSARSFTLKLTPAELHACFLHTQSWKDKGETRSKKYVVLHLDLRLVRLAAFFCILFSIFAGTAHFMGWLGWNRANAPVRIDGDQVGTKKRVSSLSRLECGHRYMPLLGLQKATRVQMRYWNAIWNKIRYLTYHSRRHGDLRLCFLRRRLRRMRLHERK